MKDRLLIVDDERDLRDMLDSYFRKCGYEVLSASSGEEAVRLAKRQPDLILLDIGMPGMDGYEVCRSLRSAVTCPILFLTARFDQPSGFLRIVVSDDGPGFTPEALSHAAEPYYRGSDAEADVHFGLGLYICRLLCEKHGGRLALGSAPSGGAEVTAEFRIG